MTRFMRFVHERHQAPVHNYASLHRWSVEYPEQFWSALWDFGEVRAAARATQILEDGNRLPGARWFVGARLNYAENLLRRDDPEPAIVYRNERGERRDLSFYSLRSEVARVAQGMRRCGVKTGDRVCAFLPNTPEAVVAMLAAASIGAIWYAQPHTSTEEAVRDALKQLRPRLLFVGADRLKDGTRDNTARLMSIVVADAHVEHVVLVSKTPVVTSARRPHIVSFERFGVPGAALEFSQLPFDAPCLMTRCARPTDTPKYVVHRAGGVLLQQLKELALHNDVRRGDRFLCLTTCGDASWYALISALAVGATIVLHDSPPLHDEGRTAWHIAAEERVTLFGVTPAFLQACKETELRPSRTFDLAALRTIISVAAPLGPESYRYVYSHAKKDIMLAVQSTQPDIMATFAAASPIAPVLEGEIQCVALGMKVEINNEDERPVFDRCGEIVCTEPFPSMPIGFWGDANDPQFRSLYFGGHSRRWHQGQLATLTLRGSMILHEQAR